MISDEDALRILDSMSWNDNEEDLALALDVSADSAAVTSILDMKQDLTECEASEELVGSDIKSADEIELSVKTSGENRNDASDELNVITSRSGDATLAISASLLSQWMLEPSINQYPEDSEVIIGDSIAPFNSLDDDDTTTDKLTSCGEL